MTLLEMLVLAVVIAALGILAWTHERRDHATEHAVRHHPANRIRLIPPVIDHEERNWL